MAMSTFFFYIRRMQAGTTPTKFVTYSFLFNFTCQKSIDFSSRKESREP